MSNTANQNKQNKHRQAKMRLWMLLVILIGCNILASQFHIGLDLTADKKFTLSNASVRLLKNLKDVVVVDVYLKGEFPSGFKKLSEATKEKLNAFQDVAGTKVVYRFINPFEGKAIKFATEQELNQLAELAKGYGLEVKNLSPHDYNYHLFRRTIDGVHYSNYNNNVHNDTEITYSDFIASLESIPNHTEQQPDMVNHPKHYNVEGYEVIDIIKAFGLNFPMGSALKYLLRAERKGKKIEDLKKAIWCIQYEIEQREKLNVIGA